MTQLPGQSPSVGKAPQEGGGVLTTLLRTYIEKRDRTALDTFYQLLYDEKFSKLALIVRKQGPVSDATVHEVIDETLAKFLEQLLADKVRKPPKSAERHLRWILKHRFLDRRKSAAERATYEDIDDVKAADDIVDPQAPQPASSALAQENQELCDRRLEEAIARLGENDQKILRLRIAGLPYASIAAQLGIDENSMWSAASRAVERLMSHLAERAPTMALRIKELKARGERQREVPSWPSLDEVEAALSRITERVKDVITRVHLRGESREAVSGEYGDEAANALLKRGYDLLEARFKVPFPEAFERAAR